MLLRITRTDEGLRVEGELDMASAGELRQAIEQAIEQGGDAEAPLVLDLAGLTFMDSSGLSLFLEVARSRSGALVLLHPTRAVRRVLDISLPQGAEGLEVQG